jgi:AcrR family transcriptional regulator
MHRADQPEPEPEPEVGPEVGPGDQLGDGGPRRVAAIHRADRAETDRAGTDGAQTDGADTDGAQTDLSDPDDELIATTDGRIPGHRGRATRQRLLECTAELLVATPWRSIKVIDIARRAGTSPATFYQYFENVEAAITVLAEELVEGVGVLAGLVDGDWSDELSWTTAVEVVEGFMEYWERNRAVFRVVELTTVEGDLRFQGLRVRALNAVTVTLARVIATNAGSSDSPAGSDPMAAAGTLIAMLAQVAGHRYGFEFWGIRTASLVDSQARLLHWAVTGRAAPAGAKVPGSEALRPRTGPVLGGGAASARTAEVKAAATPKNRR